MYPTREVCQSFEVDKAFMFDAGVTQFKSHQRLLVDDLGKVANI